MTYLLIKKTQQNKLTLAGNHEYKETDSIQSHSLWVTLYLAQEKKTISYLHSPAFSFPACNCTRSWMHLMLRMMNPHEVCSTFLNSTSSSLKYKTLNFITLWIFQLKGIDRQYDIFELKVQYCIQLLNSLFLHWTILK